MPPCGWECARDLSGIRKGARHDRPLDQSQISASSTALWCHLVEYLLTRSSQWVVQLISDRGPMGAVPCREGSYLDIALLLNFNFCAVCMLEPMEQRNTADPKDWDYLPLSIGVSSN